MKAFTTALLASAIALTITLPAQADRGRDSVYGRLSHQQAAIERGIDSGALTIREARILRGEHSEARDLARDLKRRHGRSHDLRRALDRKLDRLDRDIRHFSHNDEVRRGHDRHPPRGQHHR